MCPKLFQKAYNLECLIIPPHKKRSIPDQPNSPYLCRQLPTLCYTEEKQHINTIIDIILIHAKKQQRAVLVISPHIKEAHELNEILQKNNTKQRYLYTGEETFHHFHLKPGDIILATSISGRGTDFIPNQTIENNGGLHVLITYLPTNSRVELQNTGRTSRAGNNGTCQFILYNNSDKTLPKIHQERLETEKKEMTQIFKQIENIQHKDQLFQKFWKLYCWFFQEPLQTQNYTHHISILYIQITYYKEDLEKHFYDHIYNPTQLPPSLNTYYKHIQKKIIRDTPTQNSIKERWGIWLGNEEIKLEQQISNHQEPDYAISNGAFRKFVNLLYKDILTHNLIQNSYLHILQGNTHIDNINTQKKDIAKQYDTTLQKIGLINFIPNNSTAYTYLYKLYYSLKENEVMTYKKAITCYTKAITQDPLISIFARYNRSYSNLLLSQKNTYYTYIPPMLILLKFLIYKYGKNIHYIRHSKIIQYCIYTQSIISLSLIYNQIQKTQKHTSEKDLLDISKNIQYHLLPSYKYAQENLNENKKSIQQIEQQKDFLTRFSNHITQTIHQLQNPQCIPSNIIIAQKDLQILYPIQQPHNPRAANVLNPNNLPKEAKKNIIDSIEHGLPQLYIIEISPKKPTNTSL